MSNTDYIELRDKLHREFQDALNELRILEKEEHKCEMNYSNDYQEYKRVMEQSNFAERYEKASIRFENAQMALRKFLQDSNNVNGNVEN